MWRDQKKPEAYRDKVLWYRNDHILHLEAVHQSFPSFIAPERTDHTPNPTQHRPHE